MRTDAPKLAAYFDAYIERRSDLAKFSLQTLRHTRNAAVEYFGGDRDLASITVGDAKDYFRFISGKLATATVAMHVKKLRQVWVDAIDHELIAKNPWRSVKAGTQVNAERQHYVPVSHILKVIDACPDYEWRLLFALARFGGLRIPSEPRGLRWQDINFESGRILIHSPKTKHHPGKATRSIPMFRDLFPWLEPMLLDALGKSPDGSDYVLGRLRLGENFATTGYRIVKRAGLVRWPRFWQNLRSSCETDLATKYPIHVVCQWIGNSAGVAMRHYLQVTDTHFDIANGMGEKRRSHGAAGVAKTSETYEPAMSPTGALPNADSLGISQAAHSALQRVYRREAARLGAFRRDAIHRLQREVKAARRRGAGR